jgi:hypothetical protein
MTQRLRNPSRIIRIDKCHEFLSLFLSHICVIRSFVPFVTSLFQILVIILGINSFVSGIATFSAYAVPPMWETDLGSELTQLTEMDDKEQRVPLAFDFPYFGIYYREILVNTNGLIDLHTDVKTAYDKVESFINSSYPRIAPFWSDMDLSSAGKVFVNQFQGRTVITWSEIG